MTASAEARDTALLAAQAAADKLATDVSIVDVSDRLAITDAFVLASAPNERQVQSIVDAVEERLREHGIKPVRREGVAESRWVLLDFVDVVVHVQHAEERAYYALERLWKDCPTIPFADRAAPAPRRPRRRPTARRRRRRDARPTRRRPTGDLAPSRCCRCRGWCSGGTAGPSGTPPGASRASSTRRSTRRAGARPASPRRTWSPPACRGEDTVVVSSDLQPRRRDRGDADRPARRAAAPRRPAARARDGLLGGPDPRRGRPSGTPSSTPTGWPVGRCGAAAGRTRPTSPSGRSPRWPTCRPARSPSSSPTAAPPAGSWSGCSGSAPTTVGCSGRWATAPGASSSFQGERWRLMRHNSSALQPAAPTVPRAAGGLRAVPPLPATTPRRVTPTPATDADAVL